ncbi:MAG: mechanosensitive ion channel domain-containing protein [Desulfovibrio sp.]
MNALRLLCLTVCCLCGLALSWEPPSALAGREDPALWSSIAEGLRQSIVLKKRELAHIKEKLPAARAALAQTLAQESSRLDQVLLLRGVAGETPWASRTLIMQLGEIDNAVDAASGSLEDMHDRLARTKEEYATLRQIRLQNASREYTDLVNEELTGPGRDFKALKDEVDTVKVEVDAALSQATGLKKDVRAARANEVERFVRLFGETYFASSGSLLRLGNLRGALDDLRQWYDAAPRFWGPIVAWTDWGGFCLTGLFGFVAFWAVITLAGRRWPAVGELSRPGLFWLAVGLGLGLARHTVLFAGNQFTSLPWVLATCWGLVLLMPHGPVLSVLFGCFAAAACLDVVNTPASIVGALWLVVAAFAIVRLRRAGAAGPSIVGFFAATAAAGLFGFGPQASALTEALFMLLLTLGLTAAIQRRLDGLAAGRKHSLAGLAGPLAVTLMATLYVAWVLVFMGGPGLMDRVFGMRFSIGKATFSLDALATLCVVFFLLRLVQAWFAQLLAFVRLRGRTVEPALAHTMGAVFSYLTWTLFVLFGLHLFAVPLGALTWIASGLSVGIGFGLKDIVNNFVSGLIIMFGGAVKKGDIIQQGKNFGEVVDLSVRNTIMRTLDNTTVIIPNSSFLRGEIVNLTYQDASMRLTIPVTVAPGTKLKKVRKILLTAAKKHPDVLKSPPPEVAMIAFARFGLQFELYVWIDNFMKKFQVQSELATTIDQEFQDNKVMLAFQGVKVKYKPKGTEAMQLDAKREELRRKRSETFKRSRTLRRVHVRKRWPAPAAAGSGEA